MRTLRPSVHPSSRSRPRNAVTRRWASRSFSLNPVSTPMRRTRSLCCAPAARGHAAAAPPSAASNSRRLMMTVIRPSRARCVKWNDTTPRACSLAVQGGQGAGCFDLSLRLQLHYSRRRDLANAAIAASRVPSERVPNGMPGTQHSVLPQLHTKSCCQHNVHPAKFPAGTTSMSNSSSGKHKYHVALSFAGEDRNYVEKVAAQLTADGVSVFYDKYEEVELWGKDLYTHLKEVYEKRAVFTVMFISEHYQNKLWTNHERKAAQARAFEDSDKEYILPAFFDKAIEVPGLTKTTGHISLANRSPEQFANLIVKKLSAAGIDLPKQFPYGDNAKADVDFPMRKGAVTKIISDLKSYTWPRQEPAIKA